MPSPAFLFDLDGVLVDTHQIVIDGWRAFADSQGRGMTEAEIIDRFFGRRTIDILVDFFAVDEPTASRMVAAGFDDKTAEVERVGGLRPVPGATEFVRAAVAGGTACAVVSSASAGNIALALDSIGLAGVFAAVIDQDRVKRGKPWPDPYLAAAVALDVPIAECVVFEDTPVGISSGRAAGARCVGVASLGRPDLLGEADLVVADFRGLTPADLVKRLGEPSPGGAVRAARYRDRSTAGGAVERPS